MLEDVKTTAEHGGQVSGGGMAGNASSGVVDKLDGGLGDAIDDRVAEALDDYIAEGRLDGRIRPRRSTAGFATVVAAGVAAVLLPWCLILAATLPATYQASHWKLAWIGLDCATAVAAGLTAYFLHTRNSRAVLTAMAAGTLLLADAWFDVSTAAPGFDHTLSLAEALLLELPLALCAFLLASRELRSASR
jgi:hypothetical protein